MCREAIGLHSGEQKNLRWSKDAEENDMKHMKSNHRRVMAQFVVPAKKKKESQHSDPNLMKIDKKQAFTPLLDEGVKIADISRFEGRYQELEKGVTGRSGKEHEETAAAKQDHAAMAATCASEASAGVRHSSDTDAAAAASRNPAATADVRKEAAAGTKEKNDKEDEEIMALIRERKTTIKDDKERIREVSKKITKCIRDKKKIRKTTKNPNKNLEEMKGTRNIANIKSAKRQHERRSHNIKRRYC